MSFLALTDSAVKIQKSFSAAEIARHAALARPLSPAMFRY